MSKKTLIHLFLIFLGIATTKILIGFLYHGPYIMPDEGCLVETAKYFANNFKLTTCDQIINTPAGTPPYLTIIIYSVFYAIFHPITAFKIILIFNSLLVSSLLFPLYKIFKNFVKEDLIIYFCIGSLLFIPQFIGYENSLMSEILFSTTTIWLLYFYMESFNKNKTKNKIISIILGIISIFLRPFGFLSLSAIMINEFFLTKNKKMKILVIIPVAIIILLPVILIYPHYLALLADRIKSFYQIDSIIISAKSILTMLNSLSLGVITLPLIIIVSNFNNKNFPKFQKIKYFIFSFIILNILISSQVIYEFSINNKPQIDLLTRYLNVSILFIIMFSIIFLLNIKKFKLNIKNIIISVIILIPVLFLKFEYSSAQFIHEYIHILKYPDFINNYYIFIVIGSFVLLLNNTKKILIATIFLILFTNSALAISTQSKYSYIVNKQNAIYPLLENENKKILYLQSIEMGSLPSTYWLLKNNTENKIESVFFKESELTDNKKMPPLYTAAYEIKPAKININDFEYILTHLELEYPKLYDGEYSKIYIVE